MARISGPRAALLATTVVAAVCVVLLWAPHPLAQTGTPAPTADGVTFPAEITGPEGTVVVYQPQPEKLNGNVLTGRAAISIQPTGTSEPIFGAAWFTSMIDTDTDAGIVTVRDLKVTKVQWPDSKAAGEAKFTRGVEEAAAKAALTFSLERLSASLASAEREQKSLAQLKNDPPKIVFVKTMSVLILYDGAPRWSAIENSQYERAINTPYLVVRDKRTQACYFGQASLWYTAKDPMGPWQSTKTPPADLVQMMPKPDADAPTAPSTPPAVVTATEPTELIVTDGEPRWKPVGAGEVLYVENTETPWVREVATNQIYVLLSGRWFRAASTNGPWTFVRADQLPPSFAKIPAASDVGGVRVSIAGTEEAEDAMLDAEIPQTSAISRSDAKLDVKYEGAPKFEPIPGTSVSLAQNTSTQVLLISGKYYAVDNGVWFAASSPTGPWAVADSVPQTEIQKIPPSSPAYNVTHVHVYESTPQVVYVGYTPGYMWSYPYYGVPVYGTGFYYPYYPGVYYPRPVTYGLHVGYNPWTGWSVGMSWNVGFMHFGMSWGGGYGPYYRPGGWYGGRRPGYGGYYRNTTININNSNNRINIGNSVNYGNRNTVSKRMQSNPRSQGMSRENLYNRPDTKARNAPPAAAQKQLQGARSARSGQANDVLADRNGNVVRQTSKGLEQRTNGKWENVDRPSAGAAAAKPAGAAAAKPAAGAATAKPAAAAARPAASQVDRAGVQRDAAARSRGTARTTSRQSVQRPTTGRSGRR